MQLKALLFHKKSTYKLKVRSANDFVLDSVEQCKAFEDNLDHNSVFGFCDTENGTLRSNEGSKN